MGAFLLNPKTNGTGRWLRPWVELHVDGDERHSVEAS